ncbi:MAG: hypothetical protein R3C56_15900 [Pirellulaceae bacterium]
MKTCACPPPLAEAELVSWLASAEQYGIAPQHVELIDTRTQFWPWLRRAARLLPVSL